MLARLGVVAFRVDVSPNGVSCCHANEVVGSAVGDGDRVGSRARWGGVAVGCVGAFVGAEELA